MIFYPSSICLTVESNLWFFQIVLQGQDNRQGRGSNVGEKSFRCEYEGCGKLYTTAHHLKVSVGVLWLFVPTQNVGLFKDNILPTAWSAMWLGASLLHAFVCVSCRYTSVPTPETNHMSVTILAVGRSLQQVTVENSFIFIVYNILF